MSTNKARTCRDLDGMDPTLKERLEKLDRRPGLTGASEDLLTTVALPRATHTAATITAIALLSTSPNAIGLDAPETAHRVSAHLTGVSAMTTTAQILPAKVFVSAEATGPRTSMRTGRYNVAQ